MSKKQALILCGVLLLIMGAVSLSVSRPSATVSEEEVTLGAVLTLTGPRASIGEDGRQGIELAMKDFNNAHKTSYQVVYEDSKGSPQEAPTAYQALRARGVTAMVTQNSNVSTPISVLTNQDHVLQMGTSVTVTSYSSPNDYTFRINGDTTFEAAALVTDALTRSTVDDRVALFVMNDEYTKDLGNSIQSLYKDRYGKQIEYVDTFDPGDADFRTAIIKLKEQNPSVFYLIGYQTEMGTFVKQAYELGFAPSVFSLNIPANRKEFMDLAWLYMDGMRVSFWKISSDHPAAARFEQAYGKKPNAFAANAYDAATVLMEAVHTCGGDEDTDCLQQALFERKPYDGLSGIKKFDENGDAQDAYVILRGENGVFVK